MSIHWIVWVWDNSPYEGTKLLLHLALADFADDEGNLFASQAVLAKKSRCSEEYIRRSIKHLVDDGYVEITKRGNSKGRATTYKIWGRFGFKTLETPNYVGESDLTDSTPQLSTDLSLTPQLWQDNSPTLTPQPPNSASKPTVLYNSPNTTVAIAKAIAEKWWEQQEIKPIGKNAFWSLVEVCKAALTNGYTQEQVEFILTKVNVIPSMPMMDNLLKKNIKEFNDATKARKDREMAKEATRKHLEALSNADSVPMPEDVKTLLRGAGLLRR
jgi:biotin operon repressor